MRRNVIGQGNNSYTLTLPIEWIRDNNLSSGDEIELKLEDNNIIVSILKKKPLTASIVVNLKKYSERSIKNIVFQLYRKGFDKIICTLTDTKQKEMLKKIVRQNVLGFEVTDEENGKCIIENVAEPSKEKFTSLLNKLFFIIKTNSEEIIKDLQNSRFDNLTAHTETRNMFDLYTNFLRRIVIKERLGGNKDSYLLFYFVSQLSNIEHCFYYSYDHCAKNKIKLDDKTLSYLTSLSKYVEFLHEAFCEKNLDKTHVIGEDYLKMTKEMMTFLDSGKSKSNFVVHEILMASRFVNLASTVIFGLGEYQPEP
jgi:phosphate uptake regulator